MIARLRKKTQDFFTKGHERTILTKKNIAASFVIKGITILISLVLIPMTINYVNSERNGIWLTLYSMVIWLNLLDIGFGNGMKNRLTEAKANGDTDLAKKYVSSTYAAVCLICLGVFFVFCLITPHLNWLDILGSNPALYSYQEEISGLLWIIMVSFCFTFVLNLLKSIVAADQRPAIGSFLDLLGQGLTLIGIFILYKTTSPSLIYLGWVTGFAPVLVYMIASYILFNTRYKCWRPSLKYVDFNAAKNMMSLGIKFFISSVAFVIVNQTLPFLILRTTNPIEVTNYNMAFRLFSMAFNVMCIIFIPYWSSFTDAYTKKDFEWMKNSMSKLYRLFTIFLIVQFAFLILAPTIYYVWVNYWLHNENDILTIPFSMSMAVCIYMCVTCWISLYIHPLNGIGKIRLQVYSSIGEMILLIPVAFLMSHYWGAVGIIWSPVIIYIPRMIWAPLQLNKLMNLTAKGIWNK
ncbi:MAG: MATE family efflux transporter [Dysgonamonadaceae bacterium]|jgi:O-antigen/teichoic acid export membrane protein|nr:MATE family efflux transporter [Dysgonamonadaceae bacterium]